MAGRIPQAFIDELLSRVDIVEIIDARVRLRKSGREYTACCPFHNEKTPSFTVSPGKQFYHCFGCGAHGTALGFVMDYEHLSFPEAVEELARRAGLDVPREADQAVRQSGGHELLPLVEGADRWFQRQLREHPDRERAVSYLKKRGLSGEVVKAFGIGYAPPGWDGLVKALTGEGAALKQVLDAGLASPRDGGGAYDRFRDRVMFPIRDRRGRTIAFGGRVLDDATPKYLNSPETPFFHKGRELYGLYEARMTNRQLSRLVVVEGYMDVVALAQHGIPYAVATLGTATTPEHLERLFRVCRELVFCFDGDRAGRDAAWRALGHTLPQLRDDRQVSFLFLPEGEDPDSLVRGQGKAGFESQLQRARPLVEYLFRHLETQASPATLDGRARLLALARPLLERVPAEDYRQVMVGRLAELTRMDAAELRRHLRQPAAEPPARRGAKVNLQRSAVRTAIALLLNDTRLSRRAGDLNRLRSADDPGIGLLVQLLDLLQAHPNISTAALILERYRDSETRQLTEAGRILEKLAHSLPEIPETLYEQEFMGAMKRLEELHSPEKRLLDRLARGELAAEELEALRKLGRSGHVKN